MPVFIPIAIGAATLATGATVYFAKDAKDKFEEISEDTYKKLQEKGTPVIENLGGSLEAGLLAVGSGIGELGEDLGTGLIGLGSSIAEEIGDLGQDFGAGALRVIKKSGVAIIEGAEEMVDYTWDKVSPYRVEAVTALTAITIYVTTAVILFKKIRNAS